MYIRIFSIFLVMNNININNCVQVLGFICVFSYLGFIFRSEAISHLESHGNSKFLKHSSTVFQRICTILYSNVV